jgi:hypothetical protein
MWGGGVTECPGKLFVTTWGHRDELVPLLVPTLPRWNEGIGGVSREIQENFSSRR